MKQEKIDNEKIEKNNIILPVPLIDGIEEIKQNLNFLTQTGEVKYGIEILDDATGFILPGTITIIAACPNVGKSLVAQIIANTIAKQGKKVLYCSCEMSPGQLMMREMRRQMGTSNKQLLDGYKKNPGMIDDLLDNFIKDKRFDYLNNILVQDICDMHVDNLIEIFETYKDYKYIIVDYIQSLKGTGVDERTEFKYISKALQTFTRRTNRCVIECSQIPKTNENESRSKKEGVNFQTLKAKGAGNWEEDADIVIKMAEELEGNVPYILINLSKNRCEGLKFCTYKYQKTPKLEMKLISKGL